MPDAPRGGLKSPVDPYNIRYIYGDKRLSGAGDLSQYRRVFQPDMGIFSPNYPLVPPDPEVVRTWDFQVGRNLVYTPRAYEPVGFGELIALARTHDLTRLAIETREDQIQRHDWRIRAIDEKNPKLDADSRINKLTAFWKKPDTGDQDFATWVRQAMEQMLVHDAPAFEVRKNRGGDIIGIDNVAGETITVLIDVTGRVPEAPAPAYEQVIHGRPWKLLSKDQMIYYPRNRKPNRLYGFSPVEQILMTINTGLRRQLMQLQHFTEGNVPPGMLTAPNDWTIDKIKEFQDYFDSVLAGNTAARTRLLWVPAGTTYEPFKEAPYKDEFDEWLVRIVCYAFSLPPTPFIKQMNRAVAQTVQDTALEEGLGPMMGWVKRLIDHVIQDRMGHADLEFAWDTTKPLDPKDLADIQEGLVDAGIVTRNEARDRLGLAQQEGADELTVTTTKGLISVTNFADQGAIDPAETSAPALAGENVAPADEEPSEKRTFSKGAQRTLYIKRELLNAAELIAWAHEQDFATTVPSGKMHVTLAHSRVPVDWESIPPASDELVVGPSLARSVHEMGDGGAIVLEFSSGELDRRWCHLRALGASWDHPGYRPHVTITFSAGSVDLEEVQPFDGELVFGPEIFDEVEPRWSSSAVQERAAA